MDKRALTREYKESRRPMGVYQIRNTVNGKLLVGVSVDLPSILNRTGRNYARAGTVTAGSGRTGPSSARRLSSSRSSTR